MTAKELRQNLRRGTFVAPFLAIQVMAVLAMVAEFSMGSAAGSREDSGVLNLVMLFDSGPFWMVVGGVCLVLMPLTGLLLMGQELEEGNHELLLLTKLNRWRVVRGKFLALWGLCALTFISLLPYVVVRYLIGGVEWWHEAACGLTVLGGSAMLCAGAIGASAFRRTVARMGVFALFLLSMMSGSGSALAFSALAAKDFGIVYHLTAVAAVCCYISLGLALARSRLRLSVRRYEVNPSGMVLGLIAFAPFVIGFVTAITMGWGGMVPLAGFTVLALMSDDQRYQRRQGW